MSYFYGARALNEAFYLEDFWELERISQSFSFHLALDRPDPEADAAGVKYTPGFVHQVIYDTYLKFHEEPEEIEYYMCGPGPMANAVKRMPTICVPLKCSCLTISAYKRKSNYFSQQKRKNIL